MNYKKALLPVLLLSVVAAYFVFDFGQYLNLPTLKAQQAHIASYQAQHPLLVAGLYFLSYVLIMALSIPGAALLTLLSGAIFGLLWGTMIVSFASTLGATLAFLMSRFLLRNWVTEHFSARIRAIDAGIEQEGAFYLFALRLVPAFPFFLINILFGLTRIKVHTFFWVSQLGMLAGTLVYVNAGTQLAKLDTLSGILSPTLLGSFILLGIFPFIAKRMLGFFRAQKVFRPWKKPARFERNLIVIGAGSAGLVSAYIAAALKAKVTLIEKNELGGDCLNTGCVPSKALIRSAKYLSHIARSKEFGIAAAQAQFEFADVMARVQNTIQKIAPHDSVERYTDLGVEVIQGTAKIISPWEVDIQKNDGSSARLSSKSIIIASGAKPFIPALPGLEHINYLTSDNIWRLRERPSRLLVPGGGPIGAELAQAFARLGSNVTLVEKADRIMQREDPDVADLVMARFKAEGINLRLQHQAKRFEVLNGEKILIADYQGREIQLAFDALLIALGRKAHLEGFGLEELGIPTENPLQTDEYLQTHYPNIYAAGDVAGPHQFTHAAAHQAWFATINALFDPFKKFKADYALIPRATFVEPEIAQVGLNEISAQESDTPYEVTRYDIEDLDRAIADGEAHGFIKVLTEPGRDKILGVTIVGEHAGDLIAEYVLAMKHNIGLSKILSTIHIYPTLAEANKYVAGNWKRAHASQKLLAWVERFHVWRRN